MPRTSLIMRLDIVASVSYGRRIRSAGEDDPLRCVFTHTRGGYVERHDLGVDVPFADPPRYQLRVLRAIVENNDLIHKEGF